MKKTPQTRLG